MRILHMVPALEVGGVERGTIDLALWLMRMGHTVFVISSGGKLIRDLERNGVRHIRLPVHRKSPLTLLLVPKIARFLTQYRIDIVHASSRAPAWIGFLSCRLTGIPFVTSCHGFYSNHFLSSVMGWGERVMVISKTIEKRMTESFKVPQEKIRLVYRGIDLAQYPYCDGKYDGKKKGRIVLNIGRITPLKGHYEFIQAMKRVIDRMGDIEAWIVGGIDRDKERYGESLRNLARDLGVEKQIKFLGMRSDIPDILKKADCLVLSTNVPEGFGRAVIEAGAIGTAVCASAAGGIREIIEDKITGLLFRPRDESGMADAIVTLLENPDICRELSSSLRRRVEEHFSLEYMAQKTLSVYEEIVTPQTTSRNAL